MAARTLIAVLLSGGLMAACASADDPFTGFAQDADLVKAARAARQCTRNDNRDDCRITVTVNDGGSGCLLKLEDDDQKIIAFPRGVRDKVIFWLLDDRTADGRFVFAQDGIAIDANASHDFDRAGRFDKGKGFHWRNRNPRPGEYYYAVHVSNKQTDVTCDLDPKIRNEN